MNVTSVLEGSVRKAGNRIRITAQLINSADGYHIQSGKYRGNDVVTLTSPGSSGLKYACYRLIREMNQQGHQVYVPALSIERLRIKLLFQDLQSFFQ